MTPSWKEIFGLIWSKVTGGTDATRAKYLHKQTELVIKEVWDLYEEKKKVAADYFEQLKKIDELKRKHPENGKELKAWEDREYTLMLELVKAKEQIDFYRERSIFLEHELDLLLIKEERMKKKSGGSIGIIFLVLCIGIMGWIVIKNI